jgi:uncharacterized membrane-anchored protein
MGQRAGSFAGVRRLRGRPRRQVKPQKCAIIAAETPSPGRYAMNQHIGKMAQARTPLINSKYWLALVAASLFGTNTGDLISEYFHLGNVAGLPYLAVALAAIFLLEKGSPWVSAAYFWAAIIVIRTGATHTFGIYGVAMFPVIIAVFVFAVRHYKTRIDADPQPAGMPKVDGSYWVCMALAGIVGTLMGDYGSALGGLATYGVAHLAGMAPGGFDFSWVQTGHIEATVLFGAAMIAMMLRNSVTDLTKPTTYWTPLALIRTAGTAAGDLQAHTLLGLLNATILTGICFTALIVAFYVVGKGNQVDRALMRQTA